MRHLKKYDDLLKDLRGFGLADSRVKIVIYYEWRDIQINLGLPGLDEVKGEITPQMIYKEIEKGKIEEEGKKFNLLGEFCKTRLQVTMSKLDKLDEKSLDDFLSSYKKLNMPRFLSQNKKIAILIDGKEVASESIL